MSDETFGIAVQLDPGDSVAKAKQVEQSLARTEEAAKKAAREMRDGMSSASKAFGPLVEAVKNHQSALARTTEIHNRLNAQNAPLAQGFAKVAEQMEREKRALDAIRGPAQEAAREIQTLNSMLAKGAITAAEFNAKLHAIRPPSKLGAASGSGFDASSLAGALPGGGIIAGAIGGGVAGAATAGFQTAIGGVHEIIAMSDAYTGLQNRLKNVTGSSDAAKEAFDKLFDSAQRTRSDVNSTAESFVRFSNATKSMGLSQENVLKFTEHLNEMMAMSGASTSEASAGMLQLSQAMASGVLRGDEFNSIMENAQPIAQAIATHLHVTTGELRAMAQQGQITAKIVYESIEAMGNATEKNFKDSIPTISQQFTVLKNEIGKSVGELMQMADVGKLVADTTKSLSAVIGATAEQTKLWGEALGVTGLKLSDLLAGSSGGFVALGDFFANDFTADNFIRGMTGSSTATEKFGVVVHDVFARQIAEASGKMNEFAKDQARATLEITLGKAAAEAFAKATEDAAQKTTAWGTALAGISRGVDKLANSLMSDGFYAFAKLNDPWFVAPETPKHIAHVTTEIEKLIAAGKTWHGLALADRGMEIPKFDNSVTPGMGGISSLITPMDVPKVSDIGSSVTDAEQAKMRTEAWKAELEGYKQAALEKSESIAQAMTPLASTMHDAIVTGKLGWEDWGRTAVKQIEIAIAKMVLLKGIEYAIGGPAGPAASGFVSALLGGANGFDYVADSKRLQLPGFASGGDFTVGGSGGTDSKIAMFKVTPGESVHVRTPQQREAGSSGSVSFNPIINLQNDHRDIVQGINSREGMEQIVQVDRKMRKARRY